MEIELVESDDDIRGCFHVMRELRELEDAEAFLERVRSQQKAGYRLVAVLEAKEVVAVAGFRLGENLAWGRYLYVDDLVTASDARSKGFGGALLSWLSEYGRQRGAAQIHLDSGHQRLEAHRFYQREGFEAASLHFRRSIGGWRCSST